MTELHIRFLKEVESRKKEKELKADEKRDQILRMIAFWALPALFAICMILFIITFKQSMHGMVIQ